MLTVFRVIAFSQDDLGVRPLFRSLCESFGEIVEKVMCYFPRVWVPFQEKCSCQRAPELNLLVSSLECWEIYAFIHKLNVPEWHWHIWSDSLYLRKEFLRLPLKFIQRCLKRCLKRSLPTPYHRRGLQKNKLPHTKNQSIINRSAYRGSEREQELGNNA